MSGGAEGGVRTVLRVEGLCVMLAGMWLYARTGHDWGLFALCFLAPDLAFLGYLAGPRVGAACYNATHAYVGAIASLAAGHALGNAILLAAGSIWIAHIGFDRALGYGLKYPSGFTDTHLGRIGRSHPSRT